MKKEKILSRLSLIYGIIITLLILFAFGPKLFGSMDSVLKIPKDIFNWNDNPTGFFFVYMIGYLIVWRNPLLGSVIIMLGSLIFFIFNPHNTMFLMIFLLPTFLVAIFYLWHRSVLRSKRAA
jgi:hypothetical protein